MLLVFGMLALAAAAELAAADICAAIDWILPRLAANPFAKLIPILNPLLYAPGAALLNAATIDTDIIFAVAIALADPEDNAELNLLIV